ncbi:MAG: molybdopterin oxidoreductase, partial [Myxococcota bacterium]
VHSPEGMNDMAYNRCIGTRYCANNCPYKVRRFNYLDWHSHLDNPWTMHGNFPHVRKMAFNPNVTVRMRGVMEKCSYCVQRIQEAKFEARRNQRQVRDGDIVTACQQVCAAEAIVFGDLNDPESRVAQADATNRRYKLLAEVGAQPRTTFLGKIRNPNPDLEPVQAEPTEGEAH